jgi:hypothetical protein
MNQDRIRPLTPAGINFLHSVLSRGPIFPIRDYEEAVKRGLRVSFDDMGTPDDPEEVTDPGSTSADWKPLDYADNQPGMDDYPTDDWSGRDAYPGDDQTMGE